MSKSLNMNKVTLGVCYYPEHWPESMWEDDIRRMLDHGIEVARVAEFAWSKFEPEEGNFTFGFFDRFLDLAHRLGMKVIFCTPTATPPAWLTHKYPEVLNANVDGVLYRHGMRRHYSYNSNKYCELTSRIVTEMAAHYCAHPAIIGWQIDNELNCHIDTFYAECDHRAFRAYLKDKFRTLENLNDAMGTVFWNQTYTSWDEVYLTRPWVQPFTNPHMALEEKRLVSRSVISYCKLQSDIIRKFAPTGQFVTTNGIFGHLDSHAMTDEALDFMTYDSYPNFAFDADYGADANQQDNLLDRKWSWQLSKARSISPVFGIMEQQSGAGGWDAMMKQPAPKPGQMRLWTFQSIAHGADYISYFRWRTCWVGTEIYWHGLNDYSNRPNRRMKELMGIKGDVARLCGLAGAQYKAEVALLKDYSNEWDGEQDKWHGPLSQYSENGWFTAAQRTHTPMDLVFISTGDSRKTTLEDLQKYKLLIYPHAAILTEETAALLQEYVCHGGTLIMGARTGYKDEYGRCPMQPIPGFASEICGVTVSDFTHMTRSNQPVSATWGDVEIDTPVFNDVLEAQEGTEVLATYKGSYYNSSPALVRKAHGSGAAYYFGAGFSAKTASSFLEKLGHATPYQHIVACAPGIELAVRAGGDKTFLFLLNYMPQPSMMHLKKPMQELLTGRMLSGQMELEPYGVAVFEM